MTPASRTRARHPRRRLTLAAATLAVLAAASTGALAVTHQQPPATGAAASPTSTAEPAADRTRSVSRSSDRAPIVPLAVTVATGDDVQQLITGTADTADLLDALDVRVDGNDEVRVRHTPDIEALEPDPVIGGDPAPEQIARAEDQAMSTLHAGSVVRVIDVQIRSRVIATTLPARTERRLTHDLAPGTTRVARTAAPGRRIVKVTHRLEDGRPVATTRKLLRARTPVTGLVLTGAPAPASTPAPASASAAGSVARDGLNWAALANCESSGNPRATNPAGYYGLYQFDLSTWASVGGSGSPADASAAEQTMRAQRLYASRGAAPWPHCGRFL